MKFNFERITFGNRRRTADKIPAVTCKLGRLKNGILGWPAFILFLFSCMCAQAQPASFTVYAHRGFRGLNPENTIRGMKAALHYRAALEFDLHITKDRQVVVSHDAVLNPKITQGANGEALDKNQKIPIFQTDYQLLRNYVVGNMPNPEFPEQNHYPAYIPLFKELVDSVESYAVAQGIAPPTYFVETKLNEKTDRIYHPQPEEFVDLVMQVVKEKGITRRLIVQSFDPRTLQILKKKYPEIKLAFLAKAGTTLDENLKWLGFNPHYYSTNAQYINSDLVARCKKLKVKLIIGNCNDYKEILRLAKLGVNQVISDYPMERLFRPKQEKKE